MRSKQDGPIGFSVTKYKRFTSRVYRFHIELTFIKVPLVEFWCRNRRISTLVWKDYNINVLRPFYVLHIKCIGIDRMQSRCEYRCLLLSPTLETCNNVK